MAKIVICEGNPLVMKAMLVSLHGCGHELYAASDGLEGWALVLRERPALVLTDVAMPGLSGFELVDAIHAQPDLHHVQTAIVSAAAQRADVTAGYSHGVTDYITKPFVVADLRDRVQQLVEGRDLALNAP